MRRRHVEDMHTHDAEHFAKHKTSGKPNPVRNHYATSSTTTAIYLVHLVTRHPKNLFGNRHRKPNIVAVNP